MGVEGFLGDGRAAREQAEGEACLVHNECANRKRAGGLLCGRIPGEHSMFASLGRCPHSTG